MKRTLSPIVFTLAVLPALTASVVVVLLTMEDKSGVAQYAVVMVLAYLLGSIPWGYILLKLHRGLDIREYGSGRVGMSNVLRTGGKRIAVLVLALDTGKGILVVALARVVLDSTPGR